MFIDDDLTPTQPGGYGIDDIPNNKLRFEIKNVTLLFSVESQILLFLGKNRLIATSRTFSQPPTNIQINAFVRKTILEKRDSLKRQGVNIQQELRNFS
jgi:hypothetical protein